MVLIMVLGRPNSCSRSKHDASINSSSWVKSMHSFSGSTGAMAMSFTMMRNFPVLILAIIATMIPSCSCITLPISVAHDQVVDKNGKVFQFRCVNWVGHMEPNLPEGLQHQPLSYIVNTIASSDTYNCVRLNYDVELFDKTTITARESLQTSLGGTLASHIGPFEQHNPELIDLPLPEVFQAVAEALSSRGLLVLMSNHVSKAGWCCSFTGGYHLCID